MMQLKSFANQSSKCIKGLTSKGKPWRKKRAVALGKMRVQCCFFYFFHQRDATENNGLGLCWQCFFDRLYSAKYSASKYTSPRPSDFPK